jgi:hypothetical protein
MDFSKYKFRPSTLGRLMVDGKGSVITENQLKTIKELEAKKIDGKRLLTEKQNAYLIELIAKRDAPPELSETAKDFLREIYIEEAFGRKKEFTSKFTEKGTFVEEDSISLASRVLGKMFFKNEKTLENDFIVGTPDITEPELIDIKSCWDIWTFAKKDGNDKDYYWQLRAYAWLLGVNKAKLVYTLVDAPEHLIVDELRVQTYRKGMLGMEETEDFQQLELYIDKIMRYGDIDETLRVKTFDYEFKEDEIKKIEDRINQAREYLSNMKL